MVRVDRQSPFTLPATDVEAGRVSRDCYLLKEPNHGPLLLDYLRRRDVVEIVTAVIELEHDRGRPGSLEIVDARPALSSGGPNDG